MKHASVLARSVAILAAATPLAAQAGDKAPPTPPPEPPVIEEEPLGFTLSAGYDTAYVFRGVDFGEHAIWTGLDYSYGITDALSLDLGAWYTNSATDDFAEELDLYGSLTYSITESLSLSVGYTWYTFFGDGDEINEPWVGLGYSLYGVDLGLAAYYDDVTDGFYFESSAGYGITVTDRLTITPSVALAFADDYYGVSGWNHVNPTLAADYALTDAATLSAYVAGNIPLDDLEAAGEDDLLYGGVSLAVSF